GSYDYWMGKVIFFSQSVDMFLILWMYFSFSPTPSPSPAGGWELYVFLFFFNGNLFHDEWAH
ncbi:MAG: hypothetical protein WCG83_03460, partial [Candidatus Peregrinibacteria bacterium]